MLSRKTVTSLAIGALILTACGGGGTNPVDDEKKQLEKKLVGTWYSTDDNTTAIKCHSHSDDTSSNEFMVFKEENKLTVTKFFYDGLNCNEEDIVFNIDENFNYSVGEVLKDDIRVLNLDMTGFDLHKGEIDCPPENKTHTCKFVRDGVSKTYAPFKLNGDLMQVGKAVNSKSELKPELKGVLIRE